MISSRTIAKNIDSGYITMNKNNLWMWWPSKPALDNEGHWYSEAYFPGGKYPTSLNPINIKPVKDYRKSLLKCGE